MKQYRIYFDKLPQVGTIIHVAYRHSAHAYTLRAIEPYLRKDGTPSHVLHWVNQDGVRFTSGLKGKSFQKVRGEPDFSWLYSDILGAVE